MMKIEYLQEFLILVRERNYAAAAAECYVSESGLSRHIMSLEKELGTELLVRDPKGLRLTRAGEALLPYAQRICAEQQELVRAVGLSRNTTGLRIGFADALRQYGALNALFRYRCCDGSVPELTENKSPVLWEMLLDRECDFVICFENPDFTEKDISCRRLFSDRVAAAMPEQHSLASMEKVSAAALSGERFIFRNKSSHAYSTYLQLLKSGHLLPRESIFAGNSILAMVSNGLGLTLLEEKRYCSTLPEGVVLRPIDPPLERHMSAYFRERELTEEGRKFLSYLEGVIRR